MWDKQYVHYTHNIWNLQSTFHLLLLRNNTLEHGKLLVQCVTNLRFSIQDLLDMYEHVLQDQKKNEMIYAITLTGIWCICT